MRSTVLLASLVLGVGAFLLLGRTSGAAAPTDALPPLLVSRSIQATEDAVWVELRCDNDIGCSGQLFLSQDDEWVSNGRTRYAVPYGEVAAYEVRAAVNLNPDVRTTLSWREDSGFGSYTDVTLRRR